MDDEELQQRCDVTLDDDSLLEEDKIEQIEQIVDEFYGTKNWSTSDKERLVLDILWTHRNKRTQNIKAKSASTASVANSRRVTAKVVQTTISKPLINPPPSDPSKLEPRKPIDLGNGFHNAGTRSSPSPQTTAVSHGEGGANGANGGANGNSNANASVNGEKSDISQQGAMSPFDILRSILGEENTDEQIHHALQKSEFDIQATLSLLMSKSGDESTDDSDITSSTPASSAGGQSTGTDVDSAVVKMVPERTTSSSPQTSGVSVYPRTDSTFTPAKPVVHSNNPFISSIPHVVEITTPGQEKVMCKYFLQFGECLRADCKYSHDLSSRICRFWLRGECLAGDNCVFLHEVPQELLDKWSLSDGPNSQTGLSAAAVAPQKVTLTEDEFPALGALGGTSKKKQTSAPAPTPAITAPKPSPWGGGQFQFKPPTAFTPSRQLENNEFVPRIGSEPVSSSPSPGPNIPVSTPPKPSTGSLPKVIKPLNKLNRSVVAINMPRSIPWVVPETNPGYEEYLSYRLAALRQGEMRNKYLQLAADRWNKNDAAGASALSKKGQKHNSEMIDSYMMASDLLYELRHESPNSEIFIDLHGMDLDESVDRLHEVLCEIEESEKDQPRPVYAICGAGHHLSHSKKAVDDKLSKHVKEFLDTKGYEWKDFKTTEKRFGKIIGIDPWSHI
ncbi:hypothetical protein AWJ20_919 [Sugiyamaella lignohabitans]|uniref:Uncharacterized protein n=1 Tax=Sugiyamaella lignohabitans TaxID=796027 RepID=A0A161HJ37_9ASCO|nr:uncharacterized protein AWJ20_919 [Sugiyamaella lignohabitans]ANB12657.1 hypothetical protein AWJ20_919 [Sugiyamaella lignohabitans]